MIEFKHKPVLLVEVVRFLGVQKGKKYIDATLGGGGHTREILRSGGVVLGIDQDSDSTQFVQESFKLQITEGKLVVVKGNFRDLKKIAEENGFGNVDGVVFDLGMSSHQIETSTRGFSFRRDGPLDMRMDPETGLTADEIINTWTEGELTELFEKLGEERWAGSIARAVVHRRQEKKIETTHALVQIIEKVKPHEGNTHAATQVFQALRMQVNNEIENLRIGLENAFDILVPSGRLGVISFHSLEDRIVKLFFQGKERAGNGKIITKKPVTATEVEQELNVRARSAKLRMFERSI